MKYIQKSTEPEIFRNWKGLANEDWKPDWDENFQSPEKPAVHEALSYEDLDINGYYTPFAATIIYILKNYF